MEFSSIATLLPHGAGREDRPPWKPLSGLCVSLSFMLCFRDVLLYSRRESVEGGVMSGCGLVQHTTREMKSGVKKDRERRGERKKGRQRQYDCVCVCMFMHICIREGGKNANGREGEGEVNWARRRRQRGRKKEKGRDSLRVHEQKK